MTPDQSVPPLTQEAIDGWRRYHRPYDTEPSRAHLCRSCGEVWPCPSARLLASLAALTQERDVARRRGYEEGYRAGYDLAEEVAGTANDLTTERDAATARAESLQSALREGSERVQEVLDTYNLSEDVSCEVGAIGQLLDAALADSPLPKGEGE